MSSLKRGRHLEAFYVQQLECDLAYQASFLASLANLRDHGELCDCVLVSDEGTEYEAHRIVLTAASGFFKALYVGGGQQMLDNTSKNVLGQFRVKLRNISSHGLSLALSAMYQQDLQLTGQSVEQLLEAAAYLQIDSATEACRQFLMTQCCTARQSIWTMALAEQYGFEGVLDQALFAFEKGQTERLQPEQMAYIPLLSRNSFQAVFQTYSCKFPEIFSDSFQIIAAWADAEPVERAWHVTKLCEQYFKYTSLIQLEAHVKGLQCAPEVHQAFSGYVRHRHRQYKELLDNEDSIDGPEAPEEFAHRSAGGAQVLIAGGHDVAWQSLRSVEVYSHAQDKWSQGAAMPSKESFAGCAMLADKIALVGGGLHGSTLSLYSPANQTWSTADAPSTPHQHSAVAAIQDSLFVLGGRAGCGVRSELKTVEVCNAVPAEPSRDAFSPCFMRWHNAACMTVPRACLAAATLQSTLYAAGGQAGRMIWDTAEAYDPHQDVWSLLTARMHSERKYTAAGVLHGRLYVVGGMTSARTRLCSVEAYDPREGRWQAIPDMTVPRSSAGAAALADGLLVVGGNAGDDTIHSSVEMYVPSAGKWLQRAPIAHARSGLAIATV